MHPTTRIPTLVAAILLAAATARAQPLATPQPAAQGSGWHARLLVGTGLPDALELAGREVRGPAALAALRLGHAGPVARGFGYSLGAEAMGSLRGAELEGRGRVRSRMLRVGVEALATYALVATPWTVEAGSQLRFAAPFEDLELRRRDNVRADLRVGGRYAISGRLSGAVYLATTVRPWGDAEYVLDPRHQVLAGLQWSLSS